MTYTLSLTGTKTRNPTFTRKIGFFRNSSLARGLTLTGMALANTFILSGTMTLAITLTQNITMALIGTLTLPLGLAFTRTMTLALKCTLAAALTMALTLTITLAFLVAYVMIWIYLLCVLLVIHSEKPATAQVILTASLVAKMKMVINYCF